MSKIRKAIYVIVGFLALSLGAVGVVLPILPTTPFLLLASVCFVKGSERFDKWFKGTKLYKKHLESFVNERSMTLGQKIFIIICVDIMMAFPLILVDHLWVKILIAVLMLYKLYYFIFKVKTIKVKKFAESVGNELGN